ncbi:MAG: hypothetical protein ACPHEP_13275 [Acidimicrobiales bacterium]
MADPKANLLNFTIDLNRDGNLEFNLDCVDTIGMERVVRPLGDPAYGPRIGKIVRNYFRELQEMVVEQRT